MKALQEQFVIDTKGEKTAVILPFKRYEQLLEDIHDLAVVAERKKEESISFEEIKKRLKKMVVYNIKFKPSVYKNLLP